MAENINNSNIENSEGDNFSKVLEDICQSIQGKSLAIFCGAGISFNSGLPTVWPFLNSLLDSLNVGESEKKVIIESDIPFESLIEIIHRRVNISSLLDCFDGSNPNTNHILIAKLAKSGKLKYITTTNFDTLIEQALTQEGLVEGADFQVYTNTEELESIDWGDTETIHVIKIHGSITDKENLVVLMSRMVQQELYEKRLKTVHKIFTEGLYQDILVMGYSCSDVFSVSKHLEEIRESALKVILLEHGSEEKVVPLSEKQTKNPFQGFSESLWLHGDTDKIIETIWENTIVEAYNPTPSLWGNGKWKEIINNWKQSELEQYSNLEKKFIVADILLHIGEYEKAQTVLAQNTYSTKEMKNPEETKVLEFQRKIKFYYCRFLLAREEVFQSRLDREEMQNIKRELLSLLQSAKNIDQDKIYLEFIEAHNIIADIYLFLDEYERAQSPLDIAKEIIQKYKILLQIHGEKVNRLRILELDSFIIKAMIYKGQEEAEKAKDLLVYVIEEANEIGNKELEISARSCLVKILSWDNYFNPNEEYDDINIFLQQIKIMELIKKLNYPRYFQSIAHSTIFNMSNALGPDKLMELINSFQSKDGFV